MSCSVELRQRRQQGMAEDPHKLAAMMNKSQRLILGLLILLLVDIIWVSSSELTKVRSGCLDVHPFLFFISLTVISSHLLFTITNYFFNFSLNIQKYLLLYIQQEDYSNNICYFSVHLQGRNL